jgi:hypothetical protein
MDDDYKAYIRCKVKDVQHGVLHGKGHELRKISLPTWISTESQN